MKGRIVLGKLLLVGGTALLSLSVLAGVITLAVYLHCKKKLGAQLDKEYGEQKKS